MCDGFFLSILTAHASVEGAVYGGERSVLLGKDFLLPKSMITDPRLDYVALGHVHKAQNLNEGNHPPVICSGSIERVDFGEVKDDKFFVVADVEKGQTEMDWRKLEDIRPFHDRYLKLSSQKEITAQVISALPAPDVMEDAVVRLVLAYPRAWAEMHEVELDFIEPGKPAQNAYIERFNRTHREAILDAYLFSTLQGVRDITDEWIEEYNTIRPHEALDGLPLYQYLVSKV